MSAKISLECVYSGVWQIKYYENTGGGYVLQGSLNSTSVDCETFTITFGGIINGTCCGDITIATVE